MTTEQFIILIILNLLIITPIIIGIYKVQKWWFIVLIFLAFFSLITIDGIFISYVTEGNKKPVTTPIDRYEQVIIPNDTLYRKIK